VKNKQTRIFERKEIDTSKLYFYLQCKHMYSMHLLTTKWTTTYFDDYGPI